jgi:hypothetical protein
MCIRGSGLVCAGEGAQVWFVELKGLRFGLEVKGLRFGLWR